MSSAGDDFILNNSNAPKKDRTPYSKKYLIYQNDTNNGQYQNSISFDLSSFANIHNGFLSLSEASLEIPLVFTALFQLVQHPVLVSVWITGFL